MDITKIDNTTYSIVTQVVETHTVADDEASLADLTTKEAETNQRLTDIAALRQPILDRLTAASQAGVSDATVVVQDQSN